MSELFFNFLHIFYSHLSPKFLWLFVDCFTKLVAHPFKKNNKKNYFNTLLIDSFSSVFLQSFLFNQFIILWLLLTN
jgi:hypothetical protein